MSLEEILKTSQGANLGLKAAGDGKMRVTGLPWEWPHPGPGELGRMWVIARPKLTGFGMHVGLQLRDGSVVHFTDSDGACWGSYDGFAQYRPVTVLREVSPALYAQIMSNVQYALSNQRPYHFTDWNCESFVNALICESPKSPTVTAAIAVALIAVVAYASAK